MDMMVVGDRRIRGLGVLGQAGSSYVHVRAIDKEGRPISDALIFVFSSGSVAADEKMRTNGGGWAVVPTRVPVGSPVELAIELPEGTARRRVSTVEHISGHVDVFQSVMALPQPAITTAETVGFGLSLALVFAGLYIKERGAQEVVVGLGSGLFAVSGFSLIFRHLR